MGVRQYKSGDYYLDYRVNGRRVREIVGPNKKAAEAAWYKRQTEIAENKYLDKRKDEKIKFKDFAQIYLENHSKVNKRSWENDVRYLQNWSDYFGDKLLIEVTSMAIEQYKAKRVVDVSQATVNRELACLKCLFNKAIQWKKFYQINPMKGVKSFKEDNQRTRYLDKDEMFRLLDECGGELKSIVMVAANTGMRRGEIADLKWADIDLNADLIYIRRSKSGKGRIIPMNRAVKEVFNSLYIRRKKSDGEHIFQRRHREGFEAAVDRAKIDNFKFHDLRHHFASHATMAGMDLNTLREILGHTTLAMTQRYSHLSPSHKAQAVKLLDSFWTVSDSTDSLKKENSNVAH